MYQTTFDLYALAFKSTVKFTFFPKVLTAVNPVPAPSLLLTASDVLPATDEYSILLIKSDLI